MRTARLCEHTFVEDWLSASSIVVDFGLNRGEFSSGIALRFGCRIWGAEPDPRLFLELPAVPGLTKLRVAIGGADGHATFHLNAKMCSSLLFAEKSGQTEAELTQVPVLSLPTFLATNQLERIHLLKIDIEGAEIAMFDNCADEHLLRIEQMTIEFHQFMDPKLIPDVRRVISRLRRLGFFVVDFSRDRYDGLFINTNLRRLRPWSKLGFQLTKYRRGLSRVIGGWIGRRELRSWTAADELTSLKVAGQPGPPGGEGPENARGVE